jgi:response regulator NasT
MRQPSTSAITEPASAGKGRILVVDDDRLVLATVTQGLVDAGYEVIDADNGDDAETLRDKYAIPFMFLSAFADERTLATVKSLGALAYLVKPLEVGQIVPAVEAAFGRLRAGAAPPRRGAAKPAPPAVASDAALGDSVLVAVGVLMHRYSLPRALALQRLRRQADEAGLDLARQAERVLAAVEDLSRG